MLMLAIGFHDIDFAGSGRTANKLLVADDLEMGFAGRKLFSQISFTLAPGASVALKITVSSTATTGQYFGEIKLTPSRAGLPKKSRAIWPSCPGSSRCIW